MAFVIYARVSAACHESDVPTDTVERLSVEAMLERQCLEQEVPKAAQDELVLPIISLKNDRFAAMADARQAVQAKLAPHFAVTFQAPSVPNVIWIRTPVGHESIGIAFDSAGVQRTFDMTLNQGGTPKNYKGVIVFFFRALGVDAPP